ncbi:hypothetical protein V6N12_063312 [Hibiscus sabdariffa]|uniref:Uncharacterized protein n=1 Tax=Hibiscus sabdariffa TaxID=183260 RepID=A0ABR2FBG5_9ROSI
MENNDDYSSESSIMVSNSMDEEGDSLIDPFPDTVLPYIVHDVSPMTQPQVAFVSRESAALLPEINSGVIEDNVSSPLVPEDVHIHEFAPASISNNGQDDDNYVSDNVSDDLYVKYFVWWLCWLDMNL